MTPAQELADLLRQFEDKHNIAVRPSALSLWHLDTGTFAGSLSFVRRQGWTAEQEDTE